MTDLKWVIPLLNVTREHFYNIAKYFIRYILLAEYGMAETYFGHPSVRFMKCNLISFGPKYFLTEKW